MYVKTVEKLKTQSLVQINSKVKLASLAGLILLSHDKVYSEKVRNETKKLP
jgi:hypothetical protein